MVQIPSTPMQAYLQDSQRPKPAAERENRKVIWCVCIVSNIPHENNFYGHFIEDQPTHVMNLWFIIYTFLEYHAAIISMLLSTNSHIDMQGGVYLPISQATFRAMKIKRFQEENTVHTFAD